MTRNRLIPDKKPTENRQEAYTNLTKTADRDERNRYNESTTYFNILFVHFKLTAIIHPHKIANGYQTQSNIVAVACRQTSAVF